MAGTDRIRANALHDLQLPLSGTAVDGGSERAQIVVVTDTSDLEMASIEQEPLIAIERDSADPERRDVPVYRLAPGFHGGNSRVEIWLLQVPAPRIRNR